MAELLRILIVEDHPADIDLMLYELHKAGFQVEHACAQSETDFLNALGKPFDLILADYTLPQFNGMRALELLQGKNLDIPFILISGTIDEEVAFQAIKKGAADYILKDRMARLGPAVNQALVARQMRLDNQRVEQALHESEAKFRNLVQQAMEGIILANEQGDIVEWNKGIEIITGISHAQAVGKPWWDVLFQLTLPEQKTPEQYSYLRESYLRAIHLRNAHWFKYAEVQQIVRVDGSLRVIEGLTFPVESEYSFWLCSVIRDVTGHVLAEQESRRQAERAEALVRVSGQLNSSLDLESILDTICKETTQTLSVQAVMVFLYDPIRDQLDQKAFFSLTQSNRIALPSISLHTLESYVQPGKLVTIMHDLGAHSEWELDRLYKELNARSAIFVRMTHDERFVGILSIYACGEVRDFSEDEISLLTGFANQAAVAISNAMLFEQVRSGRENLQALSRRLVEVQEEERRSIARALHDEFGQALTGLKMLFNTLPELAEPAAGRLQMGRSVVDELIERTRSISLDLRPSMLDDLGLLPALLWHIERCREQSKLDIDFKHSGIDRRFSPAVETAAYRIIQEGSTNIIRHSGVQKAQIRVWVEMDELHILVEDRGIGFVDQNSDVYGRGGGLSGMRERAALLGGKLIIRSVPNQGTSLTGLLPLNGYLERRDNAR